MKSEKSLLSLFKVISDFESGSGAKLNQSKTEALWLGAWKDRQDKPLGLSLVKKTKILGVVFGSGNVERDNWEPRISKLDKCLQSWKTRLLSLIGKVLIYNILRLSKLCFVASVLTPPRWVYDQVNQIIWPFLWGSHIETVARRSLVCPVADGGLGLKDFQTHGQASCLALLINVINSTGSKGFFLLKHFCSAQLASMRRHWSGLRDNCTPSGLSPPAFYPPLLTVMHDLKIPSFFLYTSKEFYSFLLAETFFILMLHRS